MNKDTFRDAELQSVLSSHPSNQSKKVLLSNRKTSSFICGGCKFMNSSREEIVLDIKELEQSQESLAKNNCSKITVKKDNRSKKSLKSKHTMTELPVSFVNSIRKKQTQISNPHRQTSYNYVNSKGLLTQRVSPEPLINSVSITEKMSRRTFKPKCPSIYSQMQGAQQNLPCFNEGLVPKTSIIHSSNFAKSIHEYRSFKPENLMDSQQLSVFEKGSRNKVDQRKPSSQSDLLSSRGLQFSNHLFQVNLQSNDEVNQGQKLERKISEQFQEDISRLYEAENEQQGPWNDSKITQPPLLVKAIISEVDSDDMITVKHTDLSGNYRTQHQKNHTNKKEPISPFGRYSSELPRDKKLSSFQLRKTISLRDQEQSSEEETSEVIYGFRAIKDMQIMEDIEENMEESVMTRFEQKFGLR